ncbi:MAG: SMI1/KNR4 family protein [Parachlamydiales bacterium]
MNGHVTRYYQSAGGEGEFFESTPLHEIPERECAFEEALSLAPNLPKGWYELAHLSSEDRIEFVKGYWHMRLPFVPHIRKLISHFFAQIDDIGIFLVQRRSGQPHLAEMVYSLSEDRGFFHGSPGASGDALEELEEAFPSVTFPPDYLAFLQIHDGFCKGSDSGLLPSARIPLAYENLQGYLEEREPLQLPGQEEVDPRQLIPFYQSFGLPCYQAFYADWYPEGGMGNLYYSGEAHTLSNFQKRALWADNMAFPTFLDWLVFYLEVLA